jgi:hypothetical protein
LVEGLSNLKKLLEAAGYSPKTDETLEGYDRIYVDDPFGNRIELLEPLSNRSTGTGRTSHPREQDSVIR